VKFTRETQGVTYIRAVHERSFTVAGETIEGTLLVTSSGTLDHAVDKSLTELDIADMQPLLDTQPEVVIVGTGGESRFTPRELMFSFARAGMGLECMETRAAARTFNVLAGEGRRVAALLYPADS
jgi:uncharacterized protein